jgi:hypothetical protein
MLVAGSLFNRDNARPFFTPAVIDAEAERAAIAFVENPC